MQLGAIDWLIVLRRTVGVAALVMALSIVAVWIVNFSMTGRDQAVIVDGMYHSLVILGWAEIIAGLAVLAGLAAGWWLHRPLWAPGVLAVVAGMGLHWGWWLLDRTVDFFGTSGFTDSDPELVRRSAVRMWVMLGFDALAVVFLLLGAAMLLLRRRSDGSGSDEPADEPALDTAAG